MKPSGLVTRFDVDGVDVRMLDIPQSNKHGTWHKAYTFAKYALLSCWYAATLKADVVIVSSGPLSVGIPGLAARYLRGTPLVFEARDLWPENAIQLGIVRNPLVIWLARLLERTCYRAASAVVASSEGQAAWIRQTYGFTHVEVVTNISDNELAERMRGDLVLPAWARGKRLAVFTGTLSLIHDCSQILETAHFLQNAGVSEFEFVIIGDGAERGMLEQRAQDMQLQNVHFLGLVSKETAMKWLTAADCSLSVVKDLPYLATASPIKLFDSFTAGAPVIQTTQGWMKELLERSQCGLTVPPNDPAAMADAIVRVGRDTALKRKLSANAKRVATEQFDRKLLTDRMWEILRRAASAPQPNRILAHDRTDEN